MVPVLSAAELLQAWETALPQRPLERALTLLAAAFPYVPRDELLQQALGRRNAQLVELRASLFGSAITGLADCPQCGERISLEFDLDDLRSDVPLLATQVVTIDDFSVTCHVPGTHDLLLIANVAPDEMRERLLRHCLETARRGDQPFPIDQLPAHVLDHIAHTLAEVDPQADVQMALACPACGHAWQVSFDIAGFLWAEINAWAQRMLHDNHVIASAYGWRESEILALSPWRRQRYLELIGA